MNAAKVISTLALKVAHVGEVFADGIGLPENTLSQAQILKAASYARAHGHDAVLLLVGGIEVLVFAEAHQPAAVVRPAPVTKFTPRHDRAVPAEKPLSDF